MDRLITQDFHELTEICGFNYLDKQKMEFFMKPESEGDKLSGDD